MASLMQTTRARGPAGHLYLELQVLDREASAFRPASCGRGVYVCICLVLDLEHFSGYLLPIHEPMAICQCRRPAYR